MTYAVVMVGSAMVNGTVGRFLKKRQKLSTATRKAIAAKLAIVRIEIGWLCHVGGAVVGGGGGALRRKSSMVCICGGIYGNLLHCTVWLSLEWRSRRAESKALEVVFSMILIGGPTLVGRPGRENRSQISVVVLVTVTRATDGRIISSLGRTS